MEFREHTIPCQLYGVVIALHSCSNAGRAKKLRVHCRPPAARIKPRSTLRALRWNRASRRADRQKFACAVASARSRNCDT